MYKIDWDDPDIGLGKYPDSEIAKRIGVPTRVIVYARRKRGILDFGPPRIDWASQPLGEMPDRELADRLGVRRSDVLSARKRRGIPPPPALAVAKVDNKLDRLWLDIYGPY